jgi:hypothetical protein
MLRGAPRRDSNSLSVMQVGVMCEPVVDAVGQKTVRPPVGLVITL